MRSFFSHPPFTPHHVSNTNFSSDLEFHWLLNTRSSLERLQWHVLQLEWSLRRCVIARVEASGEGAFQRAVGNLIVVGEI